MQVLHASLYKPLCSFVVSSSYAAFPAVCNNGLLSAGPLMCVIMSAIHKPLRDKIKQYFVPQGDEFVCGQYCVI